MDAAADLTRQLLEGEELEALARKDAQAVLLDAETAIRDRRMFERLENLLIEGATNEDRESWLAMDAHYEAAFREYGIDVWNIPREEAVRLIRASALRIELADALELWASVRVISGMFSSMAPIGADPSQLPAHVAAAHSEWFELIYDVDRDALRTKRRRLMYGDSGDLADLEKLLSETDFKTSTPRSLSWLASAFSAWGAMDTAFEVLRRAALEYPGNAMLHFDYAYTLTNANRWEEAARHYMIAIAIRPKTGGLWRSLAKALDRAGDQKGALDAIKKAASLQPDHAATRRDLERMLKRVGE